MKKILSTCLLLVILHAVTAQTMPFIDSILRNRILKIPFYEIPVTGTENLILRMNYGQSSFIDTAGVAVLQDAQILSVDLLFSDYPAALDLRPLNKSRLTALCQLVPGIETQANISWSIVRQTDGYDKSTAEKLVHGFVVNYRKNYTPEEAAKELDLVQSAVPTPPPPEPPKQKLNHWAIIHRPGNYSATTYNDQPVKRMGESRKKLLPFQRGDDTIVAISLHEARERHLLPPANTYATDPDSVFLLLPAHRQQYQYHTAAPPPPPPPVIEKMPRDSTVINGFNRNHFTNALVVMDVTGSMAPYIAQLLQWMGTQDARKSISYLFCFNDGNKLPDRLKQIDQTGGIYGEKYTNSIQAAALVQKTMQRGNGGGDLEENTCEALRVAIKQASDYNDVVLIADSWAPVRDTALIASIHKPVHIIVCGKRLGIHPDYITLALATGGSLHFTDRDLPDLQPLRDGKEIIINQCAYYFENGRVLMKLH